MKLALLIAGVLSLVAAASVFPPDPSGIDVIDRAFVSSYFEGEEIPLYITLFNNEGAGTIMIQEYQDGSWETVCKWNPRNFGDEFIVFDSVTVLSYFDLGETLQISWIDDVQYYEGMVSFYVMCDYQSREWEESWVD